MLYVLLSPWGIVDAMAEHTVEKSTIGGPKENERSTF
jgi:hypothetical protein